MKRIFAVMAVAITTFAIGCSPGIEEGFGKKLVVKGGCADVVMFATSRDDELMLTFQLDGPVARAQARGKDTTTELSFPSSKSLVLERGSHLSKATCNDFIENEPHVDQSWKPVRGSGKLVIRPGPKQIDNPRADLILDDVTFEPEGGGDGVDLPSFELLNIHVGWLAG